MSNNILRLLINGVIVITMSFTSTALVAAEYKVPPTKTTHSSVPYISDKAMKKCVVLYNHAEWLKDELNTMNVDQYSQKSIDNYNNKVNRHTTMTQKFNRNCAGKQSYSAWKVAQELNNQ